MPATIISSILADVSIQSDGRPWVHEVHTDSLNIPHDFFYLAVVGADLNAALPVHAAQVLSGLQGSETTSNAFQIGLSVGSSALTFNYTVQTDLFSYLKGLPQMTQGQMQGLAKYLMSLPAATLITQYGFTPTEVQALSSAATNTSAASASLQKSIVPGGGGVVIVPG